MEHQVATLAFFFFLELKQIPEKEHAQSELFALGRTGCIITLPVQIRPRFSLRMQELYHMRNRQQERQHLSCFYGHFYWHAIMAETNLSFMLMNAHPGIIGTRCVQ